MSSLKESKSKLSTKEARSVESTRSLQVETILSTSKDPLEFLGKRGYEAKEKDLIGEGAFAK